ncbi:MAG: fimbrillin family protein [Bacteroidales bacterium]|nr:fimbrillin family protein [Bacteroidales bacterium]
MKKTYRFTLLLALPLLLAACTEDSPLEVENESASYPIRFHTSIQGMTRATYQTDLSNLNSFKVAALTNETASKVYFSPMEVTHESDGSWKNTITYYWPPEPLKFYGFAPSDLPVNITATAQQLSGFTVASKSADQKDIITAWGQGVRVSPPATNGPIALNFRHALAQIEVYASNPSDTRVEVLGVKICRISSTGTMYMQQSEDGFPAWSLTPNSAKDFFIKGDRNAEPGDPRAPITMENSTEVHSLMFGQDSWLLIPQTLIPWSAGPAADGAYLAVLCTIHDGSGRLLFPDEEGLYGFSAVPIDTIWEPGHRYVYTLNFFANGGSAGVLDPYPLSPDDPNDPDIDPTPGGNRQGGDIVVNSPITFTVEITDWINHNTDNTDIGF